MSFGVGEYLVGLALLLLTLGACIAAGVLLTRRWLGHLRGAPWWLAAATMCTATTILAHLVPGALGILTRVTVPVCALLVLAGAVLIARRGRPPAAAAAELQAPADPRWSQLLGAGALLILGACAIALEYKMTGRLLVGGDTTNFQVPTVARWLQSDSMWGLNGFVPQYSNATYPQHGNVLILALVLPFERPFLAILAAAPYFALAVLAAYALGRELGAPRGTAMSAAAAFGAVPRLADVGLKGALTDVYAVALIGVGIVFLLRHHRTGRRPELLLAALALGLAAGTKWYALPYAAAILGVYAAGRLLARRPLREVAADAARVVAVAGAAGGAWLVRNWIETGNPLFPVKVAPLGVTIFDAGPDTIRERGGFTILDYLTEADIWRDYFIPAFRADFGLPAPVLVAGMLVAAVLALRRPGNGAILAVAAVAGLIAFIYAGTPYSAFGPEGRPVLTTASTRYALPALLAAAGATAWMAARSGRLRPLLEGLLVLAALQGIRLGFPDLRPATLLAGFVVAAAVAAAGVHVARNGLPRLRPPALAAAAVVALVAVALVGDRMRARYAGESYGTLDPVYAALLDTAPEGARIAVAGSFPIGGVSAILPAMGPALGNEVEYLGPWVDGYLRRYERPDTFAAGLERGGYDLVLIGRGGRAQGPAREEAWARAAGWEPVAQSRHMALLRRG